MGFLSGVLGAVKDENEVTTYDNYISEPNKKLQNVLDLLTKNLGSGRAGLAEAVCAVKGWLEGWEGKMGEITKIVLGDENSKMKDLEDRIEENILNVKGLLSEGFDTAQSTWYATVTEGLGNKVTELKKAIDALDSSVRIELSVNLKLIKLQVEDFEKSARRDEREMRELGSTVKKELEDLEKQVKDKALQFQERCIRYLTNVFNEKIKMPIEQVKVKLGKVKSNLEQWSGMAKNIVDESNKKVNEILKKLKNGDSDYMKISRASHDLYDKADTLLKAIDGAKEMLQYTIDRTNAAVAAMDKALRMDLNTVKTRIDAEIKSYLKSKLLATIKGNITQITNQNGGLQEIQTRIVRTYARRFKQDGGGFASLVTQWIVDILNNNVAVREDISEYIRIGKLRGVFKNGYTAQNKSKYFLQKNEDIAARISVSLALEMKDANVDLDNKDNAQANIKAVYDCIHAFAQELDAKLDKNKLESSTRESYLDNICEAIETEVVESEPKNAARSHLKPVVRAILAALYTKANQALTELESFTGEGAGEKSNIGKNLDSALEVALTLFDNVQKASTSSIGVHPFDVDKQIESVLNQNVGESDEKSTVNIDKVKTFAFYHGDNGNGGKKKALSEAIKSIDTEINNHIKAISDKDGHEINSMELSNALKDVTESLGGFANAVTGLLKNNGVSMSLEDYLRRLNAMLGVCGNRFYGLDRGLEEINTVIGEIIGPKNKDNTLEQIISDCDTFYGSTLKQQIATCVTRITHVVADQVYEKIDYIKTDGLRRYVNSATKQMIELGMYIQQHKKRMNEIIKTHKTRGLKGLLHELLGKRNLPTGKIIPYVNAGNLLESLRVEKNLKPSEMFTTLSDIFKHYMSFIFEYTITDVKRVFPDSSPSPGTIAIPHTYSSHFEKLRNTVNTVLDYLKEDAHKRYTFDESFNRNVEALENSLNSLSPVKFGEQAYLNLDSVTAGLKAFVHELRCAYVNTYSGATTDWSREDNPDKKNCAKVCLTTLCMLYSELTELRTACNKSRQMQIHLSTDLGLHLKRCGYQVSADASSHDGELRNCDELNAFAVRSKITREINGAKDIKHIKACKSHENVINVMALLSCLCDHLHEYYETCHYSSSFSKKQPRSVYEMLCWLTGLPHNRVYSTLSTNDFGQLFEKADDTNDAGDVDIPLVDEDEESLVAYPAPITAANLRNALRDVCAYAEDVLIAFLGHGHAGGRYACDFNTNPDGFAYPTAPGACLDMLCDVLYRVRHQLYFLFQQFYFESSYSSWRDCLYGRGISGSSWKCNTKQCPNHDCNQKAKQKGDQMGNQTFDQHCDQYPMCDLKSPLQSFLEDGLQGFLPHQFTKPGCKLECATGNHKAIPCKTPMGFGDISNMASHTQKGTHLRDVLIDFCGNVNAPLTLLSAYFNCLLQRPPQNLGDMFAFYFNLLRDWSRSDAHKKDGFDKAVKKANFENQDTTLELGDLFTTHNDAIGKHTDGHLSSLVNCDGDNGSNCGRYLKPISTDVYTIYSSEYADKYVSWIVYLTETFYDLLKKLYEECNGNCGPKGSNCHNKCCVKGCPSLEKESKNVTHDKDCTSIVQCKHTLPTLCRYGFTFWYQTRLNGEGDINKKRTCKDFCNVLERVLSDKEKDRAPLAVLIYETIPAFLFTIRAPFIWLNVALWLLSLLYLIHIMVIRLDLLHIKSHLHSPSSHRIAAQSLLAAGRVNKLGRVFYLQP